MARFVGVIPSELDKVIAKHAMTPTEQALLFRLLMEADYRTGVAKGTLGYFADVLGVNRRNLGKHFDALAAMGVIAYRFPRGHEGRVEVLCYEAVVHGPWSHGTFTGHTQGTKRPKRPGGGRTAPHPARDETSQARGRFVPSDQGSPVWSEDSTLLELHAAGDTVPPPDGADVTHSWDAA